MQNTVKGAEREAWPDLARAAAILMVVLFHARHSTWLIGFENDQLADKVWWHVGSALTPLRMPLFFIISGMFATSAITRPWQEVSTKRVWNSVWLYGLWAFIYTLLIPEWPNLTRSDFSIYSQIGNILIGNTPAWYLWALAAYFVIARMTRLVPTLPLLLATLALSMVASELDSFLDNPPRLILQSAFFFILGSRCRDIILSVGQKANIGRALLYGAWFFIALIPYRAEIPFIFPFVGLSAALFCITLASVATRHSQTLQEWGGWLGARTLPVYVIHFVVLTLLLNLAAAALPVSLKAHPYVALLAPIVLAAVTVVASLAVSWLLPALRMGWLLSMPLRFQRR